MANERNPRGRNTAAPVVENERNLTFEHTKAPSKWKEEQGVSTIEVKENPKKAGSYFMTDEAGAVIGGVSPALVEAKADGEEVTPVISWVTPNDDPEAESFFLLHRKGDGAETIFAL